jgi:hypothetical protein
MTCDKGWSPWYPLTVCFAITSTIDHHIDDHHNGGPTPTMTIHEDDGAIYKKQKKYVNTATSSSHLSHPVLTKFSPTFLYLVVYCCILLYLFACFFIFLYGKYVKSEFTLNSVHDETGELLILGSTHIPFCCWYNLATPSKSMTWLMESLMMSKRIWRGKDRIVKPILIVEVTIVMEGFWVSRLSIYHYLRDS